jgi:hypothetical protein
VAADPSSFYRTNEEVARELARLERSGALDRLLELLAAGGLSLRVQSVRESEGLEELLGVLSPRLPDAAPETPVRLALAPARPTLGGCSGSCAVPPTAERVSSVREELARPRGGFDYESYVTARSQFVVVYPGESPDGDAAREVYMPDHVCPGCWNDRDNKIDECARVCARCGFRW